MLKYKTDLMRHIHSLKSWFAKTGSKGQIDLETMIAHIGHPDRGFDLLPQFVLRLKDGHICYTNQLHMDTVGFVGWLPYPIKAWPIAQDKLQFKAYATEHGLATPRYSQNAAQVDFRHIVKKAHSSFGYGIRGPYRPENVQLAEGRLEEGEYYEEIIFGKIARAWYWNTTLTVLELIDMPKVVGNGTLSFVQLIRDSLGAEISLPSDLDRIAAVQGIDPDAPLPAGMEAIADYRYVSPLNPSVYRNFNVLDQIRGSKVHAQFEHAGRVLFEGIPEYIRNNTAFVVDAIVDGNDKVWLLEMNCNPQLHPDIYPAMLNELAQVSPAPTPPNLVPTTEAMQIIQPSMPTNYTVDVATSKDKEQISTLRREALNASKEISLIDIRNADWSVLDEDSIVVTVREDKEIVSSMRMTIFKDPEGTQQFLQYPVAQQAIAGPILAMSRAVTSPRRFNSGLMGIIRYAYLVALEKLSRESPIENVVAIVYQGAPRVNSMQKAGYRMLECNTHWDSEAKLSAPPLIAVLAKQDFQQALAHTETEFASIISQCTFDWDAIHTKFHMAPAV